MKTLEVPIGRRLLAAVRRNHRRCHWCHGTGLLPCHICDGTGRDCLLGCTDGQAVCGCVPLNPRTCLSPYPARDIKEHP